MKVNIVMLSRGRDRLLNQTIDTLRRNTPHELFNLTVIQDWSDETYIDKEIALLRYHENENWVYLTQSKSITGQARNLGIYWAEKYWGRGDYLYLTDNDMYFTPHWLEELVSFSVLPFKVIGGWNHPFLKPHEENIFNYGCLSHDAVAGASQLMRWETWDKYGPLDAHAVGVGQSEDWKFCQDIIKGGGRVGSIYPRVVFNCGVTNSFGQPSPGADVMIKELQVAKMKYPDLYWE